MRVTYASIQSVLLACFLGGGAAMAQDAPVETATTGARVDPDSIAPRDAIQARLARLRAMALQAAEKLPEGETRVLQAIVMDTAGKVQWRQTKDAPWTTAAKEATLKPGAMIRTGLRSWMMLRVGLNAHVFVDSGSRVTLPTMAHAGSTLRTTLQIQRGRADIDVGHVGLTNDFSVLTPSGALAVRGTGMAVAHNALAGTQVYGARTNAMNAIAMQYYGSKVQHMLSGPALSTQRTPDPAAAEAFASAGPPPLQATESQDREDAPDQTTQAVSNTDPVNQNVRVLLAEQQEAISDEILEEEFGDPFAQDGFSWYVGDNGVVLPEQRAEVATALYWDMKLQHVPTSVDPYNDGGHRVAKAFEGSLFYATRTEDSAGHWSNGWYDPSRAQYIHEGTESTGPLLRIPWGEALPTGDRPLPETYQALIDYGDANWDPQHPWTGSADLRTMLTFVNEFCVTTFDGNGNRIETCRQAFANAMNAILYNEQYGQPGLTQYGAAMQDPIQAATWDPSGSDCPMCP